MSCAWGTPVAGKKMPLRSVLVRRGNRTGTTIQFGTKSYEVTFDTRGPTGGHIRMADADKVLSDEEFVTQVEDNYDRWKTDPRYKEWMTNEYMRAVIFPYGKRPR